MMQKQRKFAGHAYRCRLHENDRRGFGHIHAGGARALADTWHVLIEEDTDACRRHGFTVKDAAKAAGAARGPSTARHRRRVQDQGRGEDR